MSKDGFMNWEGEGHPSEILYKTVEQYKSVIAMKTSVPVFARSVATRQSSPGLTIFVYRGGLLLVIIASNTEPGMSQDAMVLYCWGLVHGIAILIARNEFPYKGDQLELARDVLWTTIFSD